MCDEYPGQLSFNLNLQVCKQFCYISLLTIQSNYFLHSASSTPALPFICRLDQFRFSSAESSWFTRVSPLFIIFMILCTFIDLAASAFSVRFVENQIFGNSYVACFYCLFANSLLVSLCIWYFWLYIVALEVQIVLFYLIINSLYLRILSFLRHAFLTFFK